MWYQDTTDYVSACELFGGVVDASSFAPPDTMKRRILVTVLYRYEGASLKGWGGAGLWGRVC